MAKLTRKTLFITCKEATYLIELKAGKAIGLSDRISLSIHLFICVYCRRFLLQSRFISSMAGRLAADQNFTEAEKRELEDILGRSNG